MTPEVLTLADSTTDEVWRPVSGQAYQNVFITIVSGAGSGTLTFKPCGRRADGDSTWRPMASLSQNLSEAGLYGVGVGLSTGGSIPHIGAILFSTESVGDDLVLHIHYDDSG